MVYLIWLFLGIVGYFLMRQGFLVDIGEWPLLAKIGGFVCIFFGPLFVIAALIVNKKNCFRKRM